MASMRRNEQSQFLIFPEYAFGKIGCPPRIPPNATSESPLCVSVIAERGEVVCIACVYIYMYMF